MTRNVLVVGANGHIGTAISRRLAAPDTVITLIARDADRLGALADELRGLGADPRVHPLDVCDDEALVDAIAGVGRLDIAVNNVGSGHQPRPLEDFAMADFDRVLAVNLRAVALAMKHELAALADSGTLVNVASSAGIAGAPGMSAYVAAKHGVVGLTRTAAIDHGKRGVRVNAVAPGPIESGGLGQQPEEVRAQVGRYLPLQRIGQADEVAAAVAWLAGPESTFVTGVVVPVDGGKHA